MNIKKEKQEVIHEFIIQIRADDKNMMRNLSRAVKILKRRVIDTQISKQENQIISVKRMEDSGETLQTQTEVISEESSKSQADQENERRDKNTLVPTHLKRRSSRLPATESEVDTEY